MGTDSFLKDADAKFTMADINGDELLEFNEFAACCLESRFMGLENEELLLKYIQELWQDLGAQSVTGEPGVYRLRMESLEQFFGKAVTHEQLLEFKHHVQQDDGDPD